MEQPHNSNTLLHTSNSLNFDLDRRNKEGNSTSYHRGMQRQITVRSKSDSFKNTVTQGDIIAIKAFNPELPLHIRVHYLYELLNSPKHQEEVSHELLKIAQNDLIQDSYLKTSAAQKLLSSSSSNSSFLQESLDTLDSSLSSSENLNLRLSSSSELLKNSNKKVSSLGVKILFAVAEEYTNSIDILKNVLEIFQTHQHTNQYLQILERIGSNLVFEPIIRFEAIEKMMEFPECQNKAIGLLSSLGKSNNNYLKAIECLSRLSQTIDPITSIIVYLEKEKMINRIERIRIASILLRSTDPQVTSKGFQISDDIFKTYLPNNVNGLEFLICDLKKEGLLTSEIEAIAYSNLVEYFNSFIPSNIDKLKDLFQIQVATRDPFRKSAKIKRTAWLDVTTDYILKNNPYASENASIIKTLFRNHGVEKTEKLPVCSGTQIEKMQNSICNRIKRANEDPRTIKDLQQVVITFRFKTQKLLPASKVATLLSAINEVKDEDTFNLCLSHMVATSNSCPDAAIQGLSGLERELLVKHLLNIGDEIGAARVGLSIYIIDRILSNISNEQTVGFNETSEVMLYNLLCFKEFLNLVEANDGMRGKSIGLMQRIASGNSPSGFDLKKDHLFLTLQNIIEDISLNGVIDYLNCNYFENGKAQKALDNQELWESIEMNRVQRILNSFLQVEIETYDYSTLLHAKDRLLKNGEIHPSIIDLNLREYLTDILLSSEPLQSIEESIHLHAPEKIAARKENHALALLIESGAVNRQDISHRIERRGIKSRKLLNQAADLFSQGAYLFSDLIKKSLN